MDQCVHAGILCRGIPDSRPARTSYNTHLHGRCSSRGKSLLITNATIVLLSCSYKPTDVLIVFFPRPINMLRVYTCICVTTIWRDETSYDDDTTMYNNVIRTNGSPRDLRGSLTIKQRDRGRKTVHSVAFCHRKWTRLFSRTRQVVDRVKAFIIILTRGTRVVNNITRAVHARILCTYLPRACNCHLIATSIRVVDRMYYVCTFVCTFAL